MIVNVASKELSRKTENMIPNVLQSASRMKELFLQLYQSAIVDFSGKDWAKQWRKWENFEEVVGAAEDALKAKLLASQGMEKPLFFKLQTAARMASFMGLPMRVMAQNWTQAEVIKAKEIAERDTTSRSWGEKLESAFREIRREKNNTSAIQRLASVDAAGKGTRLPAPDGLDPYHYRALLLERLRFHLQMKAHQKMVTGYNQDSQLLRDLATLMLKPKKKKVS